MSLLEWFGESRNPGPIGSIDAEAPEPLDIPTELLVLRGVAGVAVLGVFFYTALGARPRWLSFSVLGSYLLVAYLLRPRPHERNLGWAYGLIDHPFRWSDDVNRALLFLRLILWPGRFAVASIRDVLTFPSRRVERWPR